MAESWKTCFRYFSSEGKGQISMKKKVNDTLIWSKGTLSDGRAVAVKQLCVTFHQGKSQFMAEFAAISSVCKMYGCFIEYPEHRSLNEALFGKSGLQLSWPTCYGICLGPARVVAYLHEESGHIVD
ncbi:probable LRR receptor-like serine/threonine-protein kinase At1g56130 [Papaver somniferum]|uniref:probable LRR receptor-like serine/threonine-protein kinase At1g56130 n=1 Tax=Papaver somniferum TaxID=3469 RepID=UPI000E6FCF2E|nr:probable LRR receptor-like serine/threonine-protein kinase At1g56130 [Papaver somniferum]